MENNQDEKSTIEILTEYSIQTNRKIMSFEDPYPSSAVHPVVLHKRVVYIFDSKDENCFVVGFHDPKSFNEKQLYFGAFFPISFPVTSCFNIRKKDILDKLNIFSKQHDEWIEDSQFKKSTVITGEDYAFASKLLNDLSIQKQILDLLEIKENLNVGLNEVDLDFIPAFSNMSNFGVYTKQTWFTDFDIIENLFTQIRTIRKTIIEHKIDV